MKTFPEEDSNIQPKRKMKYRTPMVQIKIIIIFNRTEQTMYGLIYDDDDDDAMKTFGGVKI
jgi:hypothetical protein